MAELDRRHRALRGDEGRYPLERIALCVVPEAEVVRRDPGTRRDMYRLSRHDAGAAYRAGPEMYEVPIVGDAVDGRVLAHRRQHQPVLYLDRPELYRAEQMRVWIAPEDAAVVFTRDPGVCIRYILGQYRLQSMGWAVITESRVTITNCLIS